MPSGVLQLTKLALGCTKCLQDLVAQLGAGLGVSGSLDWDQLIGQMTSPEEESLMQRGIRLALDLQGIARLALRVRDQVHSAIEEGEAVARGKGMEEDLVGEDSLEEESSEEEEPDSSGRFQDAQDDFFAGIE